MDFEKLESSPLVINILTVITGNDYKLNNEHDCLSLTCLFVTLINDNFDNDN